MTDPVKSWSVVADKMGGHWHVAVRRGIEGSRAKLGELAFDLSDAEDVREQIGEVCDAVVTRAISLTVYELGKDSLLRIASSSLIELMTKYGESIRPQCRQLALEKVLQRFGVRIDLAKVNG